jgi:SNF2 family DNA or RNA helicase
MNPPTTSADPPGAARIFRPGERVRHPDLGEGVVIAPSVDGIIKVFFPTGERQVPVTGLASALSRSELIVLNAKSDPQRALRAWLCYQAHALPLMDNVSALTSARIDLLPHQVVLTHRVATASPRRFLIADEVGLGKTIEAALILRELMSRGELKRALMVVPAGLVNNWHRELNDVFHLNFEVLAFCAPWTVVKRRADGVTGSLEFQHVPRLYWGFQEDRGQ